MQVTYLTMTDFRERDCTLLQVGERDSVKERIGLFLRKSNKNEMKGGIERSGNVQKGRITEIGVVREW